jgi:integrase/recombinase XerC
VSAAVDLAITHLASTWISADQRTRVARILAGFVGFCSNGFGIGVLSDVTANVAESFVLATEPNQTPPSDQLVRLRRTAVRLLFRTARETGFEVGDPTLDLAVPSRPGRQTRPLTDAEVAVCRGASVWSLTDTRRSTAWALAEATCRTGELPFIRASDVDLENRRVWLHGGRRTAPRWGLLTEWGFPHVKRRLATLHAQQPDAQLLYQGRNNLEGGRVSSSLAISDVLRRAGIADDPGVRPTSISAWAGRQILEETGRIDLVAQRLGLTRLDTAADFIGWNWREDSLD